MSGPIRAAVESSRCRRLTVAGATHRTAGIMVVGPPGRSAAATVGGGAASNRENHARDFCDVPGGRARPPATAICESFRLARLPVSRLMRSLGAVADVITNANHAGLTRSGGEAGSCSSRRTLQTKLPALKICVRIDLNIMHQISTAPDAYRSFTCSSV
jgi:hypothetical protein